MEGIRKRSCYIMILLVFVVLGKWDTKMASAALSAAEYKVERNAFVGACEPVTYGRNPTPECYRRIRVSHFEYICPVITPKVVALVDVSRAIRLVEGYGRRIPRHFKCGSTAPYQNDYKLKLPDRRRKKMGSTNRGSRAMMVMLVLTLLAESGLKIATAAAPSAAQCKEERRILLNACNQVLYSKPPTPECCQRIRVSHVECVCPVITPKLLALIDVNKAIRLIEGCGRRVPRHFKCGSKHSFYSQYYYSMNDELGWVAAYLALQKVNLVTLTDKLFVAAH
ncbi:hypothetical protein RJ640_012957 [Escallonia rubra]|uniref:Bifunctional inhibitor/plant lipid transfer protein/seed storage helical domain-containing protein n=1 Tax=Escallonia rubra TaxID=112253 RepID=A0AA88QMY4_9ASTE|nr:hypothetical protein RJ640_012957 [Escallonia rubra]